MALTLFILRNDTLTRFSLIGWNIGRPVTDNDDDLSIDGLFFPPSEKSRINGDALIQLKPQIMLPMI